MRKIAVLALIQILLFCGAASAEDWSVSKIRGEAYALEDGTWHQIFRGDVLDCKNILQTEAHARLVLTHGETSLDIRENMHFRLRDEIGQLATSHQLQFHALNEGNSAPELRYSHYLP